MRRTRVIAITGCLGFGLLTVVRLIGSEALASRMDATFFWVIGVAALVALGSLLATSETLEILSRYIRSFKLGSLFEATLNQPGTESALTGVEAWNKAKLSEPSENLTEATLKQLVRVDSDRLRQRLEKLGDELLKIRGSRLLWIDDRPEKVLGERRLLRALGVMVQTAISSEDALVALRMDNDFDLIISDVQRIGETFKKTGGIPIHEGVNFVVYLRSHYSDLFVRNIPVVFYAAYDWPRLVQFTRPAMEHAPEPLISNSVEDFVVKVVRTLALSRTSPITLPAAGKVATSVTAPLEGESRDVE